MSQRRTLTFVLILLVGSPLLVRAQSVDQRSELSRFQDSLAAVTDTAALHRLEGVLIVRARKQRDDTVLHLRLGFLALRIGELGERRHYDDAASEFQWATQLSPRWPYAWFGLGLSEFALGNAIASTAVSGQSVLAQEAAGRATTALARSAVVDPTFAERVADVAETARLQRMPTKALVTLEALRQAAVVTGRRQGEVLLALGRVEREFGEVPAAHQAFERFLGAGGSRALGLLELARTRFLLGRLDGQVPYYQGAAIEDTATVHAYRVDVALIASPDELRRFDQARGADRADLLRALWRARDASDFRADGERLREHYARLYYARRMYPLASPSRRLVAAERIAMDDHRLDDRGLVYVRHGAPHDVRTFAAIGVEPNESWGYLRAGQDMVVHFVARQNPDNFKLVESVVDIVDIRGAMVSTPTDEHEPAYGGGNSAQLFRSRVGLDPVYLRMGVVGRGEKGRRDALAIQLRERALGHSSLVRATSTDAFPRTFRRDMKGRAAVVVTHPGTGPFGVVTVAWSIPGADARPIPWGKDLLYPVGVRLSLIDEEGQLAATLDTVNQVVSPRWIARDRWVQGQVSFPVTPGRYTWRLQLQQGEDAAATFAPGILAVPAESSDLIAGDLVLGARSARLLQVTEGGDTLFFNPPGTFSKSEPLEVQLAVGGAGAGRLLRTQASVIRNDERGGVAFTRTWETLANPRETRLHHVLDIGRLKAGSYTMELTVTNGIGRLVRRWSDFIVTSP